MVKHINPIWSIERALRHGYVMEPHLPSGDFSGPLRMSRPSHDCALVTAHIYRDMRDPAMKDQHWGREACAKQCDECASICHMNDYIRAKPHCPPNHPMPAIPTVVDIEPNYVVWFQWFGPELDARYIKETVISKYP